MSTNEEDEAEVIRYMHCKKCLRSVPMGQSPHSYSKLEVAETERGFLVRCVRHELKVAHIDLLGQTIELN